MKYCATRLINFFAFLVCLGLLGAAYYFQYVQLLEPCPLCIVQRVLVMALAVLFLLGTVFKRSFFVYINTIFIIVIAIVGMVFAGRKVWLEWQPPDMMMSCGPNLDFMLKHMPLSETLSLLFQGSGDCAQLDWQWLGISLSGWTFLFFLGFMIVAIVSMAQHWRSKRRIE